MTTTFEEAKLCPKCSRPGKEVAKNPGARRGVVVHTIQCETLLCKWHNERWIVQVNEDGTIPDPYSGHRGPKQYPKASQETETRINEALKRQLDAETRGDGEVRNPYS